MKRKSLQDGITHLVIIIIVVVLLLVVAGSFILDQPGKFGNYEKPPNDPETRIAWLSENVDNNDHETFISLDYEVPSWEELDKMNKSLSNKIYPDYIKATQTYGTLPNLVEVLYFGDVLKDLGANTHFVHANYWLRDGKLELWYLGYDEPRNMSQDESKRAIVHNILLAKQQGLSVVLFPDYVQIEDGGMTEHNISPDELSSMLEKVALELAPLAEKYNVEYFVPVSQIENLLTSNDYPAEETRNRMNAFYSEVVPKVRELYSGKVMYKMGGFNKWENYDGVSLAGADIFGVTVCGRSPSPESVAFDVESSATQAAKMSEEFGIPWIGIEFVINNPSDQMVLFDEVKTDYPMEELYKIGLEKFDKHGGTASGFTVHSLLGAGKIYDTPAYPLVKDFFASKK